MSQAKTSKTTVQVTLANFTYEKNPGELSDRQIIVLTRPDDTLFGVEVQDNDLTNVQPIIDYLVDVEIMKQKLREKHGLKDMPYKRFKKDKIKSIIESNITVK